MRRMVKAVGNVSWDMRITVSSFPFQPGKNDLLMLHMCDTQCSHSTLGSKVGQIGKVFWLGEKACEERSAQLGN
jgi:hypothetical protein